MVPKEIKQVGDALWEIPTTYKKGMQVPARIVATPKLLQTMDDAVFDQITNVACLPGLIKSVYCMPDGHSGYGAPIGAVAAFDAETGTISPGLAGFDINCGMRLLTTNLTLKEVEPKLKELVNLLFKLVPTGVGGEGFVKLNKAQFDQIMQSGSKWCVEQGYGWEADTARTESNGAIPNADPDKVSDRARKRGINQLGTLGSGNHYLEIQVAKKENIFNSEIAKSFGINQENQIVIMIHCGSRGFGHQVATDYLKLFNEAMPKYGIKVPDQELACGPAQSKEGLDYYGAMACAANMAFANRQVIMHRVREAFSQIFKLTPEEMEMNLVYDVAHNIVKKEVHRVNGKKASLLIHRKGATRSFGPDDEDLPKEYQKAGQPVIIGGSMETGSYLLAGLGTSEETFGSTCHGAGRTMSRTRAKNMIRGDKLQKEMESKGIYVKSASMSGLAEEAGLAYKDITDVVDAVAKAGLSRPVAGLKPIGNIKG